jgi:hypothetical protein
MQAAPQPELPTFMDEGADFGLESLELPMFVCVTEVLVDPFPAERPKAVGKPGRDNAETGR